MDALFLKILSLSLSASVMVAAVLLLRLLLKGAPKAIRCLLWAIVAARLILPVSFESSFSLLPRPTQSAESAVTETVPQVLTGVDGVDGRIYEFLSHRFNQASSGTGTDLPPTEVPDLPAEESFSVLNLVTLIWASGLVCMLGYLLISYLRLRHRMGDSLPLEGNVRVSDRIATPFVFGVVHPRIYLPGALSEEDRAYVLAHERAHLRRGDHWWKLLGFLLLSVYWFNPILWLAYLVFCRDVEFACDEKVLRALGPQAKQAYSCALINCSAPRELISACPLAFGEVGVKQRIRSVLNYKKPAFLIVLLALLACAVLSVCFLTEPIAPEGDPVAENPPVAGTDTNLPATDSDFIGSDTENSDTPEDPITPLPSVKGGMEAYEKGLIRALESSMGDSFLVGSKKDPDGTQIVHFYVAAQTDLQGETYAAQWYDEASGLYKIPLSTVSEFMKRNFGTGYVSTLWKLPAVGEGDGPFYDSAAQEISFRNLKKFLSSDEIYPVVSFFAGTSLVVDYYDRTYQTLRKTVVYSVGSDGIVGVSYEAISPDRYGEFSDDKVSAQLIFNMLGALSSENIELTISDTCTIDGKTRKSEYLYRIKDARKYCENSILFETGDARQEHHWYVNGYYKEINGEKSTQVLGRDWWFGQGGYRLHLTENSPVLDMLTSGGCTLLRKEDGGFLLTAKNCKTKTDFFAYSMLTLAYNIFLEDVKDEMIEMEFDQNGNFLRYRAECRASGNSNLSDSWPISGVYGDCVTEVTLITTDPEQIPDIEKPW